MMYIVFPNVQVRDYDEDTEQLSIEESNQVEEQIEQFTQNCRNLGLQEVTKEINGSIQGIGLFLVPEERLNELTFPAKLWPAEKTHF